MNTSAEITTKVEVTPQRSQVFLVSLVIAAIICIGLSAGLFFVGNAIGWLFSIIGIATISGAVYSWKISQADTDLEAAPPTEFKTSDGLVVSTDSRTLRSPDAVNALVQLLQEAMSRKPLPIADGLVDKEYRAIPNTKHEASVITKNINKNTQEATNALLDNLGLADNSHLVTQPAHSDKIPSPSTPRGESNQAIED